MRRRVAVVLLTFPALVSLQFLTGGTLLTQLTGSWWVLLLSLSFGSLLTLCFSAGFRTRFKASHASDLSTNSFLLSGPALGAFNIVSSLSIFSTPPWWAGLLLVSFFISSAVLFYRSTAE